MRATTLTSSTLKQRCDDDGWKKIGRNAAFRTQNVERWLLMIIF